MCGFVSSPIPCGSLVCNIYLSQGRAPTPTGIAGLDGTRDPVRIAARYRADGATLLFVDVRDSWRDAEDSLGRLRALAEVGLVLWVSVENGVIRSSDDVHRLLNSGAAAVSVNTTAVDDPAIVTSAVARFGSARLIGVVNAEADEAGLWRVCVEGGRRRTGLEVVQWSKDLAALGVGAIIVNDMAGGKAGGGFNLPLTRAVAAAVRIPVIACGGAGRPEHLPPALNQAGSHAVFVNTMHYEGLCTVAESLAALRQATASKSAKHVPKQ